MRFKFKIFLAGSTTLDNERSIVRNAITKWNATEELNHKRRAVNVTVYTYENFPNVIQADIGNEPYNKFIENEADLALFILSGTIGDKTELEFNIAYDGLHKSKKHPLLLVLSNSNVMDNRIISIKNKLAGDGKYYREYDRKEELDYIVSDELNKIISMLKKRERNVLLKKKIKKIGIIFVAILLLILLMLFILFIYKYPKKKAERIARGAIEYCNEKSGEYKCLDTLLYSKAALEDAGFLPNDPIMIEITNLINLNKN